MNLLFYELRWLRTNLFKYFIKSNVVVTSFTNMVDFELIILFNVNCLKFY